MKETIFIDTDGGVDDIVAICMIIASGKFTIGGISVVNGVASVQRGATNLSRILQFVGQQIPIYAGTNQQIQGSTVQFPPIDRKRANTLALLPAVTLPKRAMPTLPLHELQKALRSKAGPVSLLCLGPLSNMRILLNDTSVTSNIRRVTIMGGAIRVPGIVAPRGIAEYNFRLDPVAANSVLKRNIPITLVPLDATQFVPVIGRRLALPTATALSPAGQIMRSIILNNQGDFRYYYDPLAAAILINEAIIQSSETLALGVVTRGATKGKVYIKTSRSKNVCVPQIINSQVFYRLMKASIR